MLVIICHSISSQNVNQIILSCWHNSVPPADITLLGPVVLNHRRIWLLEEENYLRYTVLYMLTFQLWPVCSLFVYRVRSWVHSSALKHWMKKLVQRKEGAFLELCEKLMQTGKIFSCFSFLRSNTDLQLLWVPLRNSVKAEGDTCDNCKGFCYLQSNLHTIKEEVAGFFPTGMLLKQKNCI